VPVALCLLLAFITSCIAGSDGGDVFFLGWSAGSKKYRATLHAVNTCDAASGDTFCSDFFAHASTPLSAVVGGPALAALAPLLRAVFLGGAGACAFSILRLLFRASRCCPSLQRERCGVGFAGSLALLSGAAAGAGAYALRHYSAAAAAFAAANAGATLAPHLALPGAVALPGAAGATLMGGWVSGWIAVGAQGAAGLLLLRVACKARRQLRREREEGARGEALLRDAGVSVQVHR
jgi:hypothetical protein